MTPEFLTWESGWMVVGRRKRKRICMCMCACVSVYLSV